MPLAVLGGAMRVRHAVSFCQGASVAATPLSPLRGWRGFGLSSLIPGACALALDFRPFGAEKKNTYEDRDNLAKKSGIEKLSG